MSEIRRRGSFPLRQRRICRGTGEAWGRGCTETFERAREKAQEQFGRGIYVRGLLEISSYCKNNCYYCGIRRDNRKAGRYRMSREEILDCCRKGKRSGISHLCPAGRRRSSSESSVGGGNGKTDPKEFPDCAITLSLGEQSEEVYRRWREAGADQILLRHETADPCHYQQLHPKNQSLENRIACLHALKKLGYQTEAVSWWEVRGRALLSCIRISFFYGNCSRK